MHAHSAGTLDAGFAFWAELLLFFIKTAVKDTTCRER